MTDLGADVVKTEVTLDDLKRVANDLWACVTEAKELLYPVLKATLP